MFLGTLQAGSASKLGDMDVKQGACTVLPNMRKGTGGT